MEERDPSMGPTSRLDIVQHPNEYGGRAAYDVSLATALTGNLAFVGECAAKAGTAAEAGHKHKLDVQYGRRVPGATLIPFVGEVGGRWHPSIQGMLQRLAKDACRRNPVWGEEAAKPMLRRWGLRLSAVVMRGTAQVALEAIPRLNLPAPAGQPAAACLPDLCADAEGSYNLWRF